MKKVIYFLLVFLILIPSFSFSASVERVVNLGILGQGGLNPDKNLSRAELATVAIRLVGENGNLGNKSNSHFTDVSGWSLPYINKAYDLKLVSGVSKDKFNPNGNVTYGQVLTILMRILGYEDGIDFKKYPEDYHSKALEIGLADLYTSFDKVINRGEVASTIDKSLDLNLKNQGISLLSTIKNPIIVEKESAKPVVENKVYLTDLNFNTTLIGVFSGKLNGKNDFTGYKVNLLSKSGNNIKSTMVSKDGSFSIEEFDIGILAKLQGYKYEILSSDGKLMLREELN